MDIEELLGAFALDAVDGDERRVVEQHLDVCPRCRREVEEYREVAAMLGGDSMPSPSHVWEQIQAELNTTAADFDLAPVVPLPAKRTSHRPSGWAASAAAAVVLALAAGLVIQSGRIGDLADQVAAQESRIESLAGQPDVEPLQQAATAALQHSDARVASLTPPEGGSGTMLIVMLPDGTGYVFQNTLAPLPADRTYQLWAVVDGKVISAGMLGSQPAVVPFHLDPVGLEGLVVTEEVAGGVERSEADAVAAWFEA